VLVQHLPRFFTVARFQRSNSSLRILRAAMRMTRESSTIRTIGLAAAASSVDTNSALEYAGGVGRLVWTQASRAQGRLMATSLTLSISSKAVRMRCSIRRQRTMGRGQLQFDLHATVIDVDVADHAQLDQAVIQLRVHDLVENGENLIGGWL